MKSLGIFSLEVVVLNIELHICKASILQLSYSMDLDENILNKYCRLRKYNADLCIGPLLSLDILLG